QQIDAAFEANSKSVLVAYLLWFFFGWLSVHRFYAGKTKSAVVRLIMAFTVVLLPVVILLWIIDLFLIPSMVGEENLKTLNFLNASAPQGAPVLSQEENQDPTLAELDPKRKAMLEELRATGYKKERRDDFGLYR
ncbi:MAG: TM2 domain-containing protein, partial [Pseudomonadota bacterium]